MVYDVDMLRMFSSLLVFFIMIFVGCHLVVTASHKEGKFAQTKQEGDPEPSTRAGKAKKGDSLRVLWTVSAYQTGPRSSWGEDEARSMLFKPLDITASTITFDGKTCRDVRIKKETCNIKEGLADVFQTTPQTLGITDKTVEVVKTSCDLPGFGQYVRLRDRRLLIRINGVFFFLEPTVNY